MRVRAPYELPEAEQRIQRRAQRLEWLTFFSVLSIIVVLYLTMAGSQAMKAAWLEDILALIPPGAYLVSSWIRDKVPSQHFPYGYRRIDSVAFLAAAVALLTVALFILYDSSLRLIRQEHPSIGVMVLFGEPVWQGWIMIAALTYSAIPPVILGWLKLKPARELHAKTLYTDAQMNKADWMTAVAAMIGVIGIGFGLWWLDAVAAILIGLDVLHDGIRGIKQSTEDLMDRIPQTPERAKPDPLPGKLQQALQDLDWVTAAEVRLREEGQVLCGEAYVVPRSEVNLLKNIENAQQVIEEMDWRLYDVVITPVPDLRRRLESENP